MTCMTGGVTVVHRLGLPVAKRYSWEEVLLLFLIVGQRRSEFLG